jgi:hypothetical protein
MDRTIQFLHDMTAIDSVNPDLVPEDASAHAVEEWADIAQTIQCATILTSVLTDFCQ